MRGALVPRVPLVGLHGIIPADAGSTSRNGTKPTSQKDHPRGCGEHIAPRPLYDVTLGSSPRMRGARLRIEHQWSEDRIIPADAGSTLPWG